MIKDLLTMKELVECFNEAKHTKKHWIAIAVFTEGNESSELIINPNLNFDNKLEHYKKAYTEDLVLKTYNKIRIVGFASGDSLAEIEDLIFKDADF